VVAAVYAVQVYVVVISCHQRMARLIGCSLGGGSSGFFVPWIECEVELWWHLVIVLFVHSPC